MVWRQRRLRTAPQASSHAGGRERSLVAAGHQYRGHRVHRPLRSNRSQRAAQDPDIARGALRAVERNHFLHPAWGLVRIRLCDNLCAGTFHPQAAIYEVVTMNVELEQEYAVLKDKVRELREYL